MLRVRADEKVHEVLPHCLDLLCEDRVLFLIFTTVKLPHHFKVIGLLILVPSVGDH